MNTFKKYLSYVAVLSLGVMRGLDYEEAPAPEEVGAVALIEEVKEAYPVPEEAPAPEEVAFDPAGAVISEEQLNAGVSLEYLAIVAPEVRIMKAVKVSDHDNMGDFIYNLFDYDNTNYFVNFDLYEGASYAVFIGLEGEILGFELTDLEVSGGIEI